MIRIFLLFAIIAVGDVQPAFTQDGSPPAGSYLWSKSFGGAGYAVGYAVAADSSGNVVVTGTFNGTVDFGGGALTSAGDFDIFVAKFTSGGSHLWSKSFGNTGYDVGYGIAVDSSGDVVVTGTFGGTVDFGGGPLTSAGSTDIFVAKFSGANGSHLWSKRFGGSDEDRGLGVAVDSSGNVVVTGYFTNTVDFGGGALTGAGVSDIFVAKFSSGGSHLWSKRFGGNSYESGQSVAVDSSGNVVVTGSFCNTVDFGGGPMTSAGSYDIFVAKFTSEGSHLWSKRFGAEYNDVGESVAVDSSGNVVVTGFFNLTVDFGGGPLTSAGSDDIFVAKFSGVDGSHQWSKRFGNADGGPSRGVAVGTTGNVVVTGTFNGTVDFGGGPLTSAGSTDIFVFELSGTDGAHQWSKRFGSTDLDRGNGVAVDSSGNVVVTGWFQTSVDFGGGALTSAGSSDFFLLKLTSTTSGMGNAQISLNPPALTFSNQEVNTSSAAQSVTLANIGANAVSISSIVSTGDFAQTSDCAESLAAGSTCSISVTFTPTMHGYREGELTITDTATGSPHHIPLTGTGTSSYASLSPTALNFGNQLPTIVSRPLTVTLTNSGNFPMQIYDMTVSGEFSMSSTCGSTLEASANCSLSVRFLSSGMGVRSGQLTIWSNAPGSPHTVALSGTGADLIMNLVRPSRPIRQNGSSSANVAQVRLASNGKADIAVSCTGAPAATSCQVQPTVVRSGARSQTVSVWLTVEPENWSELSPSVTPGMNYPILVTASIGDDAQEVSVPVPLQVLPPERAHARYSRLKYKHQAPARSIDGNSNRP